MADTPRRHQRKRTAGWSKPAFAIYVGRGSPWGNPYRVSPGHQCDYATLPAITPTVAVRLYREHLSRQMLAYASVRQMVRDLRGRSVMCWCKLCPLHAEGLPLGVSCSDCAPCHGDVLLECSNA